MISRSRSAPTAEAMSIECTTSANRTVTCLYSARASALGLAHHSRHRIERPHAARCHMCGTLQWPSSDPPPIPAPAFAGCSKDRRLDTSTRDRWPSR